LELRCSLTEDSIEMMKRLVLPYVIVPSEVLE
jgi:hypothetical protein